jgi:hypothetical protein
MFDRDVKNEFSKVAEQMLQKCGKKVQLFFHINEFYRVAEKNNCSEKLLSQ